MPTYDINFDDIVQRTCSKLNNLALSYLCHHFTSQAFTEQN